MVWCPSRLHCSSLSHKIWQSCIMFSISVYVSSSLYLQLARKPWWRSRKHVHTWTKRCLLRDRMWSARIKISKQVCLPCYLFYTATFPVMTICSFHCDFIIIDCKTCLEIATKRTWSDAEANPSLKHDRLIKEVDLLVLQWCVSTLCWTMQLAKIM